MNSSTRLLQHALFGNALFSSFSAITFVLFPEAVAAFIGLKEPSLLPLIGLGLGFFAADLFHQATRPRLATWRALYASLGDFSWVAGSVILLIFFNGHFSSAGIAVVIGVAGIVTGFGTAQIIGILRAHQSANGRDYRHCIAVEAEASAEAMWAVISPLGDISRYMPELRHSFLRDASQPGVGTVRECEDITGKHWAEQCTRYDAAERCLELQFLVDEPGFPYPAQEMRGGWQITPMTEHRCEIGVWWEINPKPRWLAAVLLPVLGLQVDRNFPKLISRMAERAGGIAPVVKAKRTASLARLLPQPC